MASAAPRHRTFAIVLLTVIAVIAGLVAVYDMFRYLGWVGGLNFVGSPWFGAIMSGIVALIWFSVATQLWNLNPQGWLFMVIIAIIDLVLLLLAIIGSSTWQSVLPGLVISGLALILALLPSTKAAFAIPAKK
jgi:hypothetical protein